MLALLEKQLDRCGPEHLVHQDQCLRFWTGSTVLGALVLGLAAWSLIAFRVGRAFAAPTTKGDGDGRDDGEFDRAAAQRRLRALQPA